MLGGTNNKLRRFMYALEIGLVKLFKLLVKYFVQGYGRSRFLCTLSKIGHKNKPDVMVLANNDDGGEGVTGQRIIAFNNNFEKR